MLTNKKFEQSSQILDVIYSKGPISRIEMSSILGISPSTITEITRELISSGLIHELGEDLDDHKAGRRKILLSISPRYCYFLGIELSKKYTTLCITDNLGEIIDQKVIYDDKEIDYPYQKTIDHIDSFLEKNKDIPPLAMGIALPGHYNENNRSIKSNTELWSNYEIEKIIDYYEFPIFAKNNVKCMTISQRLYANERYSNFTFFHIKSGIFSAFIYENDFYADHSFRVGEIGHVVVRKNGEPCECGKNGCLQTIISEDALIKKAKILFNRGHTRLKFIVGSEEEINLDVVLEAYHFGDQAIIELVNEAIKYVALVINNLSLVIDSEVIYLHGPLFNDPSVIKKLEDSISHEPTLYATENTQNIEFVPFNIINGARGATALALQNTLLHEENIKSVY